MASVHDEPSGSTGKLCAHGTEGVAHAQHSLPDYPQESLTNDPQ